MGFGDGASVWDAELERKVVEVEDRNLVGAVDVSPKSTRFSTGTGATGGTIWVVVAALGCSPSPSAESSLLHWGDYVSEAPRIRATVHLLIMYSVGRDRKSVV